MDTKKLVTIEVVYALPDKQTLLKLDVESGCTAQQAVEQSGVLSQYPEIDLANSKLGIFSKACKHDYVLEHGDRVEIYRPLLIDPKQRRKEKVAKEKAEKEKPEKNKADQKRS